MNGAQVDIKPRESVKDKDKAPDSGITIMLVGGPGVVIDMQGSQCTLVPTGGLAQKEGCWLKVPYQYMYS